MFLVVAGKFQKLDGRGLLEFQSKARGDLAQRQVEMRQMIDGHIAHKGASNFIVARAPVQPPEKHKALHASGYSDN